MNKNFEHSWIWSGGYEKVPHVEDIEEIMFCQDVVVMEKIHGLCWFIGGNSQSTLPVFADRWQIHSENSSLGYVVSWFIKQAHWVQNIQEFAKRENKNIVVVGEVFGKKIFNEAATTSYGTIIPYLDYGCDIDFRVHDIRYEGKLLSWKDIEVLAEKLEIPLIPIYYKGPPKLSVFEMLLGKSDLVQNNQKGEGLIIRCGIPEYDSYGRFMIGKMKVGEYAEINSQHVTPLPVPDRATPAERLSIEYVTKQRVAKGIEWLIITGDFTGTREDIFPLTDWVIFDLKAEAQDCWNNAVNLSHQGEIVVRQQIQKQVKYWVEMALRRKLL